MSIINEYLVVFESKDSQKKDWVNTPLEPLYCLFFFFSIFFFLGAPPLSFSLLYCLFFPVIGLISTIVFIWLVVRHSDPVYFDPDAELDESEALCSESSPDANPPSLLDYSSSSSPLCSSSPSLDEAAAPCSGPA